MSKRRDSTSKSSKEGKLSSQQNQTLELVDGMCGIHFGPGSMGETLKIDGGKAFQQNVWMGKHETYSRNCGSSLHSVRESGASRGWKVRVEWGCDSC